MNKSVPPALWLLILISGLSQFSETVYTPSLPDIAHALSTTAAMIEYTLTIYLFGFALGTLFWGRLSDTTGRKPAVILGLIIYILGCIGCYFSESITALMISRLIQAFGASIGSVLGQAMCRDAFHGPGLGKAYSAVGSALAFFPAIGPVMGGFIAESYGWPAIFLVLVVFGVVVCALSILQLPETHHIHQRTVTSLRQVALTLMRDKKVWVLGFIVAACNGITFSYFAEGSFYLIECLGLSPSQYGLSFIPIAAATMAGGFASKRLHNTSSASMIMGYGLWMIFLGASLFSLVILSTLWMHALPIIVLMMTTIISQMIMMFGICMAVSNALARALVDYKWCIGTASSLFGFFYYCLISLFTLGMGYLHNDTLYPMPLYFLAISVFMLLIHRQPKYE